jgi:hypothetical protein
LNLQIFKQKILSHAGSKSRKFVLILHSKRGHTASYSNDNQYYQDQSEQLNYIDINGREQ